VPDYQDDLTLALSLADEADVLTTARFQALDLVVETKPDLTPVSDADRATEEALRIRLAVERPGDGVLGEEYGDQQPTADRRWVLDPIDGTKNFVRGVPVWATLVALMDGEDVVVGVVSAPALGRRWWAARGLGSWTGGSLARKRQLRVSEVSRLADASVSSSDDVGFPDPERMARLRRACWRSRAYGDFWSHVLVAEGAVDVAVEPELSLWDIAAFVPVVEEAGGRVTGLDGAPARGAAGALSTNAVLHDEVRALLLP
jgi:histidinol-phosphatase